MISTLIPYGDRALQSLRRGLMRTSTDYDGRRTRALCTIHEEAADSLNSLDIPHVLLIWDLLLDIQKAQASCFWDSDVSDNYEYVHKARRFAKWHSLLSPEARPPLPTSGDVQQSSFGRSPLPLYCLSTGVSWHSRLNSNMLLCLK